MSVPVGQTIGYIDAMPDEAARRRRAALRRARCTLTVTTPEASRPPRPPTPIARLAMMWPLSVEAWLLSGRPLPDYRREEMPGRVLRAGERR